MLKTSVSAELLRCADYMQSLGWQMSVGYWGGVSYVRPDSQFAVELSDDWWNIGKFTDSDIDGVAVGRFQTVEDGETLAELKSALVHAGVLRPERYTITESLTFLRFMREQVRTWGFWGAVAGFLALVGAALAAMYMQIPN